VRFLSFKIDKILANTLIDVKVLLEICKRFIVMSPLR